MICECGHGVGVHTPACPCGCARFAKADELQSQTAIAEAWGKDVERLTVWKCPVHGVIESPTFHGPPYALPDEECMYCPINLSSNEQGITDDVCGKTCTGPFKATMRRADA